MFDAQRITTQGGAWEAFPSDTLMDKFEKWIHLGDDRNVAQVWVNGKSVHTKNKAH